MARLSVYGQQHMQDWDIFCSVIDNYGDIGVTWRLARQLADEYGFAVRLWVDDLHSFARIAPGLDAGLPQQSLAGVDIRHWPAGDFPAVDAADVVIEAFGCPLPERYLAAMLQRTRKPVWINLEYLSAEDWVAGCHTMASPHPRLALTKHFFFPGFAGNGGGLLCERTLLARRAAWQADPAAQAQYWQALGVAPRRDGEWLVSVFCYESPAARQWLAAAINAAQPLCLLVPQGKVLPDLAAALGLNTLPQAGEVHECGAVRVHVLPLSDQDGYDRLLWSCDINIVRGEDSFVRAQWAGRPMLWHIYRQQEDAHLVKLEAFLQRYCAGLPERLSRQIHDLHLQWNRDQDITASWQALPQTLAAWQQHAQAWPQIQLAGGDLAMRLVQFTEKQLQ